MKIVFAMRMHTKRHLLIWPDKTKQEYTMLGENSKDILQEFMEGKRLIKQRVLEISQFMYDRNKNCEIFTLFVFAK